MGKSCCSPCYQSCFNPCFQPCWNPCCPPPCLPVPCGPCGAFYNPKYNSNCCDDSCGCCSKKSSFTASDSTPIDISLNVPTYNPITFYKVTDCNCEYVQNTTFLAKCKGSYKFNTVVSLLTTGSSINITESLSLFKNGVAVFTTTPVNITTATTTTLNICTNLCLCKGDTVTVGLNQTVVSGNVALSGARTFSGSKCGGGNGGCC